MNEEKEQAEAKQFDTVYGKLSRGEDLDEEEKKVAVKGIAHLRTTIELMRTDVASQVFHVAYRERYETERGLQEPLIVFKEGQNMRAALDAYATQVNLHGSENTLLLMRVPVHRNITLRVASKMFSDELEVKR